MWIRDNWIGQGVLNLDTEQPDRTRDTGPGYGIKDVERGFFSRLHHQEDCSNPYPRRLDISGPAEMMAAIK